MRDAAEADSVWSGEMRGVVVAGVRVLLVNVDGEIRAYEDRCPHLAARLSDGRFDGRSVVCPSHGWTFDARTGSGVEPECVRLRAYRVEVRDGRVLVDVDGAPLAERRTA